MTLYVLVTKMANHNLVLVLLVSLDIPKIGMSKSRWAFGIPLIFEAFAMKIWPMEKMMKRWNQMRSEDWLTSSRHPHHHYLYHLITVMAASLSSLCDAVMAGWQDHLWYCVWCFDRTMAGSPRWDTGLPSAHHTVMLAWESGTWCRALEESFGRRSGSNTRHRLKLDVLQCTITGGSNTQTTYYWDQPNCTENLKLQ